MVSQINETSSFEEVKKTKNHELYEQMRIMLPVAYQPYGRILMNYSFQAIMYHMEILK
jgi:hypothetical protein